MRLLFYLLCAILVLPLSAQDNSTENFNGQAVVHGGKLKLRIALVQEIDQLTRDLNRLIGSPDGQATDIVIELKASSASATDLYRQDFFYHQENAQI